MSPAPIGVVFTLAEAAYDINYPPFVLVAGGCSCAGRGDRPSRLGRIRHVQVVHRHRQGPEIDLRESALRDRDGGRRQALALRPGAAFAHAAARHHAGHDRAWQDLHSVRLSATSNPDEARIEYIILDGKRIELR
jgi:hypothetical protein